jgi:hypothetical protein
MEVPIIPETGIDSVVLEKIVSYTSLLDNHIMKYGNSIPFSSKEDYVKQIKKDFQEWYFNYPDVQSIECVKNVHQTFSFLIHEEIEEIEENKHDRKKSRINDKIECELCKNEMKPATITFIGHEKIFVNICPSCNTYKHQ